MRDFLHNFIEALLSIGDLGTPRDYPVTSSTPFRDDQVKMQKDSCAITNSLAENAREVLNDAKRTGRVASDR